MKDLWYVYVLKSSRSNFIYVGISRDVNRRLFQHNEGMNQSTKSYRPFKLKIFIAVPGRINARKLEKYLKVGSGKTILKKRLIFDESLREVPGRRTLERSDRGSLPSLSVRKNMFDLCK